MVKSLQLEIQGRPREELEEIARNLSPEFAFSHIHDMTLSAVEAGYQINIAIEQMRLLTDVCALYHPKNQEKILLIMEREYMDALTRTDSRLYKNATPGGRSPVSKFHRNVEGHYRAHGVNLTETGLVRAMQECFYDLDGPQGYPKFVGEKKILNRKDMKRPELANSGQYGGPRNR